MKRCRRTSAIAALSAISCWNVAAAQAPLAPDTLANNDAIFIDSRSLKIIPGKGRGDSSKHIQELGARELGAGALIFRSGTKFYIVEAPPLALPDSADRKGDTVDVYEERTDRIRIEYVPPKNPEHQPMVDMLKQRRVLEMLQQILSPFRLPLDVTVKTVGCDGVPNAWYDRQGNQPVISLCYEYLEEIKQKMPMSTEMPPEMAALGLSHQDGICGQFLYAALHEMGHAAFDLYDVPVLGREEDAADLFAAYLMLQFRHNQSRTLIEGAARSYVSYITAADKDKGNVTVPLLAFSSNHGTPEERFYNILCIAYGSDQNLFADLVEKEHLPKSRAAGCKYEFQVLRYAMRNQIKPHIDMEKANKVLDMTWLVQPAKRPEVHQAIR